jgi:pyruvate,orthophosphate dikinase
MSRSLPEAHGQLIEVAKRLDAAAGVAQDIEFTVQSGKLWLLQCRKAKVASSTGPEMDADARAGATVLASGRPACPGVVSGVIVTDVEEAEVRALDGEDVILARPTTIPHDVRAMAVVAGILTEVGGATSHAAVVSRELDVPCIVGCGAGVLMALEGRSVTLDAGVPVGSGA